MAEAEALLSEPEQPEEELVEEVLKFGGPSEDVWVDEDDELDELERDRKKKEARKKKRRLIFDERLGEVVAERRRKRSRRTGDWLDYDEEDDL